MTTAKEIYYEYKKQADEFFEGLSDPIHGYVTELEQDKAELIECLRLTKDLIEDFEYGVNQRSFIPEQITKLLNKHTD